MSKRSVLLFFSFILLGLALSFIPGRGQLATSAFSSNLAIPDVEFEGIGIHSYSFSIRISYRHGGVTNIYAEAPFLLQIEENETHIIYHQYCGAALDIFTPTSVRTITMNHNANDWGLYQNGTRKELQDLYGECFYSMAMGWGDTTHSYYNKSEFTELERYLILYNISIGRYGLSNLDFRESESFNLSVISRFAGGSWTHTINASSTFPSDQIDLDVENHVMTIFVSYVPLPPPLDPYIPHIFTVIMMIILIIPAIYMYARYRRGIKSVAESEAGLTYIEEASSERTVSEGVEDEIQEPMLPSQRICPNCGHRNLIDSRFCVKCGHQME